MDARGPQVPPRVDAAFQREAGRLRHKAHGSRRTVEGRLSSRMPTNAECHNSPSAIHSTNPTSTTTVGLIHRIAFMSSDVVPSPQWLLPVLFGRFANGHAQPDDRQSVA